MAHRLDMATCCPKTPGQKMIETIRNVKAVHCVRGTGANLIPESSGLLSRWEIGAEICFYGLTLISTINTFTKFL